MPRRSVFLVQREVAERMAAKAGDDAYGALSVNIAVVARVEQTMIVAAAAFRPPPKVESAVVRLTPLAQPLVPVHALNAMRSFVQTAFGQRRKQMQRVLRSVRGMSADQACAILERVGIEPSARPEVVTPAEFAKLFSVLGESGT